MNGIEVKVPSISPLCLQKIVLENSSPFGTKNIIFKIVVDGIESSFDVESFDVVEIAS